MAVVGATAMTTLVVEGGSGQQREGTAVVATVTEAAPAIAVAEVAAAEVREEMILFYY